VDLFTEALASAFEVFDPKRPLVIISEGLINYFEKPLLQQLIKSIVTYGRDFKELHYLTDLYPEPTQNKLATIIWNSSRLLKWMSRSAFSFHFKTPAEVESFFYEAGFKQVVIQQPKQFFEQQILENNQQHLGDLVWTIKASNNK
ncbi:MAG: leucine carboxyl methyltransferase, partial [Proteobacteria bacterium]|nr:leucine carboxyl methyltransferase [Pseudomonadota bacterium]